MVYYRANMVQPDRKGLTKGRERRYGLQPHELLGAMRLQTVPTISRSYIPVEPQI